MALKISEKQEFFAAITTKATDSRQPSPVGLITSPQSPLHGEETRPDHAPPPRQRADADRLVGGRRRGNHENSRSRLRRPAGVERRAAAALPLQGRVGGAVRRVLAAVEEHLRRAAAEQQEGSVLPLR